MKEEKIHEFADMYEKSIKHFTQDSVELIAFMAMQWKLYTERLAGALRENKELKVSLDHWKKMADQRQESIEQLVERKEKKK